MPIKIEEINGRKCHFIVGFIIKNKDKYLLFERKEFPFGFAGSCGHIDEGESVKHAMKRELKEETNLVVVKHKLVFKNMISLTPCHNDGTYDHMTYIFELEVKGDFKYEESEFKNYGWYTVDEISKLDLEPMWHHVFTKLGIIK